MLKKIIVLISVALLSPVAISSQINDGFYIDYFLGARSGGPSWHGDLAKGFEEMLVGRNLNVFCVEGPDSTIANSIEVDDYYKENPTPKITTECANSGWVRVGPYQNLEIAKEAYYQYEVPMLHTIASSILKCTNNECQVVIIDVTS